MGIQHSEPYDCERYGACKTSTDTHNALSRHTLTRGAKPLNALMALCNARTVTPK